MSRSLVAHLRANLFLAGRLAHQPRFPDRVRQRLLAITCLPIRIAMTAAGVRVIRRRDDHRIDLIAKRMQQLAIVVKLFDSFCLAAILSSRSWSMSHTATTRPTRAACWVSLSPLPPIRCRRYSACRSARHPTRGSSCPGPELQSPDRGPKQERPTVRRHTHQRCSVDQNKWEGNGRSQRLTWKAGMQSSLAAGTTCSCNLLWPKHKSIASRFRATFNRKNATIHAAWSRGLAWS